MVGEKLRIKEDYEKSTKFYDKRYEKIQFGKYNILKNIKLKEHILDLGCGTGLLELFHVNRLSPVVFGCDISFKMLRRAKKRGEFVVQADLEFLPFKNSIFSSILSFTALQNVEDVEKVLKEIKRISKSNATIVLTYLKKFDFSEQIKKEFEIFEIRDLGEDVGFVLSPYE